tara:strand:- start:17 stop:556 length:540 start_codon:yes stop_codon:yes gene_type:complete
MAKILTGTGKILKRNSDNMVVRAYESTDSIDLQAEKIIVTNSSGQGVEIWTKTVGYNTSNMTVHENVTLPSGYAHSKFTYNGSSWSQDSNWKDNPGFGLGKLLTAVDNSSSTTAIVTHPVCDGIKPGELIQIGSEKMTFSSFSKNSDRTQHTMTVTRAADSTTIAAHAEGAEIFYPLFS